MKKVSLPKNGVVKAQLLMLERTARPGGRDSVDHPRGFHDDAANAVAGAALLVFKELRFQATPKELESRLPQTNSWNKPGASREEEMREFLGGAKAVKPVRSIRSW
jgi:hypothetical protein